jgi:hypothetical protein
MIDYNSTSNIDATFTSNPPGILLANIWAEKVLQPFAAIINLEKPCCPLLAASEGFSRAIASATPQLYLDDAKSVFLLVGKLLSELVLLNQSNPTY